MAQLAKADEAITELAKAVATQTTYAHLMRRVQTIDVVNDELSLWVFQHELERWCAVRERIAALIEQLAQRM